MADVFSAAKRSKLMGRIRAKGNKSTELRFLSILKQQGVTGWRRHLPVQGRPDFAFPKLRLAVFIDGCFWHGCRKHCVFPRSNRAFWRTKIRLNIERDAMVAHALALKGWHVVRIWEHELRPSAFESTSQKAVRILTKAGAMRTRLRLSSTKH
jgi:DNA mismatch endonuclease (patch repair protein)